MALLFVTHRQRALPAGSILAIPPPIRLQPANRLVGRMLPVTASLPVAIQGDAAGTLPLAAKLAGTPPVFLHTGWRTRGTWIWSRFRALPRTACFYEPLNEDLATLDRAGIELRTSTTWLSGHPLLPSPYFTEFLPLLNGPAKGVRRHVRDFATAGFFAEADTTLPSLRDYLAMLLGTAQAGGVQPVLKFCRSLGRVGWMQQTFPHAIHVAVLRNPLGQFISAHRQFQSWGNAYFLAMPLLLLTLHRDVPDVAAAIRRLGVALPVLPRSVTTESGSAACTAYLRCLAPDEQYRAFLAFWLATAARIPDTVDLLIDSDLLASVGDYRSQCAIDLATLTGRALDLNDTDAGVARDTSRLPATGLPPAAVQRAHRAGEAFLQERAGSARMDSPVLSRIGAMLSYATLLCASPLHAVGMQPPRRWDDACPEAVTLAAVYASHSWRLTAPLRWLSTRLR